MFVSLIAWDSSEWLLCLANEPEQSSHSEESQAQKPSLVASVLIFQVHINVKLSDYIIMSAFYNLIK